MCNRMLLGLLFLSKQTTSTTIDDEKFLRIVGGQSASNSKYPYIVRLERLEIGLPALTTSTRRHVCTCSVLTPTWTLSASHCSLILDSIPKHSILRIVYGSNLPFDHKKGHASNVLKFILHPSFKLLGSPTEVYSLENDIALLKTNPVILPQYGRVSAVDYMSLVGFEAVVAGFGIMNYTYSNEKRTPGSAATLLRTQPGQRSDERETSSNEMIFADTLSLNKPLQTLNVLIRRCTSDVLDIVKIYPGICLAGKCGESVSICSGDSGGPLIHNSQIIGVNSMASNVDCTNTIPDRFKAHIVGMITAVSPFAEWIGKIINENAEISAHPDGKRT